MGQGFFQIENTDGQIMYSRNGQFHVNSEGLMVNSQGLPLEPQIQIPENALSISVGVTARYRRPRQTAMILKIWANYLGKIYQPSRS